MSMRARLAVTLTCLALAGCEEEAEPPLFNAKDLSVQCPTGQVGWDFSTGGNDNSIVENSVSREITVDSALLGTCNYKDDFAIDCDGKRDCTRQVKKPSSPACGGGELNLTYRCGSEPHRYNVVLPGDASSQTITLACPEPMTIISATYASNAPAANQRNLTTAIASQCTGKRRCALADPYVLNNSQDPWPNNHKETLVKYFCGTEVVPRETIVGSGQRVDIMCPLVAAENPVFDDTLRIQSVEADASFCANTTACNTAAYQARVKEWDAKLRTSCDNKKQCRLTMDRGLSFPSTRLVVKYWCTSPQAPEERYFDSRDDFEQSFDLYCGTPITIVGVVPGFNNINKGGDLAAAQAACNTKSRCVLPNPKYVMGQSGNTARAKYSYYCGENVFDLRETAELTTDASYRPSLGRIEPAVIDPRRRQLSCDRRSNNLVGGIRVVSANVDGNDALLSTTSQCFGRATCFISTNSSQGGITYRCGNSYELKTATRKSTLPAGWQLSCNPDVKLVSLECENPPYETHYPKGCIALDNRYDTFNAESFFRPGNNGVVDVAKRTNQIAHLKWTCGNDPRVYSYDGPGELVPGTTLPYYLRPRCEVPEVPYVEKACVPASCPGNMRRDAKLQCVPDATKILTDVAVAPILKEWQAEPDGGTSQWGGAETTALNEDHPYQLFGFAQYKAWNSVQLAPTTAITLWAWDEFEPKAGVSVPANKRQGLGFRCILSEAPIRDAEYPSITAGYRRVINGGKGGVLPLSCFRQDVDDGRNAWSDAARRLGITESELRRNYQRKTSWVAAAFDATGKHTARVLNNQLLPAVNPVGFFYNSTNGWIDQLGFYAQTTDFRFAKQVTFAESNEVQLNAVGAVLRNAEIKLDVSKANELPAFDVDFTWSQRGDSPARNPLSPRSLLSTNAATPLNRRNLRATIELAKLSTSEPEWVAVNATSFPAVGLGNGNAMQQTVRLQANVTAALRERMLSVKGSSGLQRPDGFMSAFDNEDTTFRVRVCMDFDEVTHALGSSNVTSASLDNKGVTASRDGVTYGLKFVRRCSETAPLFLKRELFVYPTTPVATVETPANSASSPRQGDSATSSTNDLGNQSGCTESGGTQNCQGQSRTAMTTGGQFPMSVIDSNSNDETAQTEGTKTSRLSTNMTLFGFKVFDLSQGQQAEPQSAGAWQVELNLTPNLDNIRNAWKGRKAAGIKTDTKDVKTKPKGLRKIASKFERDGLALVAAKDFPFTLGPFPFTLQLSFSVGFGFGASVKLFGDRQSVTSMVNPKYPCLKTGTGQCFAAYFAEKTFEDAVEDCRFRGGKLAEVRTAADLTAAKNAITALGGTGTRYWLGGQLGYIYEDPRCETTRAAACAGTSRTRYVWLTGETRFADQRRLEPDLLNPNSYLGNHGFGGNLGPVLSRAPNRAAVLLRPASNNLETDVITATAPYVCQYEPASSYIEAGAGVSVGVEFALGFGAKICTPSADIGFCLGITLNVITAGVNVSAERSRILVFNNSGTKVSLLGESKVEGTWEVAFISGSFDAELNFLFWSISWQIASYGGLFTMEGDLFPAVVTPYARTFP